VNDPQRFRAQEELWVCVGPLRGVRLAFVRTGGSLVPGEQVDCPIPGVAIRRAQAMSSDEECRCGRFRAEKSSFSRLRRRGRPHPGGESAQLPHRSAFPRQSAPIGTNGSLDGRKRENGSSLDALTASKSRGSGGVGSGPGRKFLRYHPPTFCTRSSAARGYPSQAHRDHALSVNPELKPIGPEFPVRQHSFFRSQRERMTCFQNSGSPAGDGGGT
jgi:hypothetical protein